MTNKDRALGYVLGFAFGVASFVTLIYVIDGSHVCKVFNNPYVTILSTTDPDAKCDQGETP